MIDYRELLMKYIAHVGNCEGVTFMPSYYNNYSGSGKNPVPFSEEEINELDKLDHESKKI